VRHRFIDEGTFDGVQFVTVLDEGFNPQEYNIPLDQARRDYHEED
jgi:hypothetical protein